MSFTRASRQESAPEGSTASSHRKRLRRLGPWASFTARVVGAAVFAIAGLAKVGDPAGTVRAVRAYRLLPEALVHPVAYALPAFEIALAALLLLGIAGRIVGVVAVAAVAVFIGAVASAAVRGLRIDCGCFGGGGEVAHTHYLLDIARDSLLLLVLLVIPLVRPSRLGVGARLGAATSGMVAAVALVGAAAVGIVANKAAHASSGGSIVAPVGATASGGIVVGDPAAPVRLIAYEDPQCPVCGEFERINGGALERAVDSGQVAVEYRMRSFLGPESARADNALAAAQDEGTFEALRRALFAHQPVEHAGGFSTDELLALGRSVGLDDAAFTTAVRSMTYAAWVARVDDQASRDGNVGTPQIIRVGVGPLTPAQTFDPTQFQAALGLR